jgi:choice-of-anchor C domain-containing protein
VNGSFETTVVGGSFDTYGTGNTSLTGWSIVGSIDHIGNYWQAADGHQSLDMNGFFAAGEISQTVFVPAAGTVSVKFSIAGNPDNVPIIKTLGVSLTGLQQFTFDISNPGSTHGNMGWVGKTAKFTAPAAGNYTLKFAALNDDGGAFGPALDNVSVTLPDGGSTLMALGMAVVGLEGFRRFRKQA